MDNVLACELGVVEAAGVAEGSSAVGSASPLGSLGTIATVAASRRRGSSSAFFGIRTIGVGLSLVGVGTREVIIVVKGAGSEVGGALLDGGALVLLVRVVDDTGHVLEAVEDLFLVAPNVLDRVHGRHAVGQDADGTLLVLG